MDPVQIQGFVEANSEEDAIKKLAEEKIIYVGWEFLEFKEC